MTNKKYDEASNEIEYLVLKNFITVLKQNSMYPMFRCVVGTNTRNVISAMYSKMNSFERYQHNSRERDENIFRDAGNIKKFVELMKATQHGGIHMENTAPAKVQQYVANCVNMLLHIFIEPNLRNIQRLEQLGGQIFEMTCRNVYGDEFQDMIPEPPQKMKEINEMMMNGQRPSKEQLEEIRRMMEEDIRNHRRRDGAPAPMFNEEDWDFLDDFLNEGEEGQNERDDEEDDGWFDDEVADAPFGDWYD